MCVVYDSDATPHCRDSLSRANIQKSRVPDTRDERKNFLFRRFVGRCGIRFAAVSGREVVCDLFDRNEVFFE